MPHRAPPGARSSRPGPGARRAPPPLHGHPRRAASDARRPGSLPPGPAVAPVCASTRGRGTSRRGHASSPGRRRPPGAAPPASPPGVDPVPLALEGVGGQRQPAALLAAGEPAQSMVTPLSHSRASVLSNTFTSEACSRGWRVEVSTTLSAREGCCRARVASVCPGPTSSSACWGFCDNVLSPSAKRTGWRRCWAQ